MNNSSETQIVVDIPFIGECTLLSLEALPEHLRTYENLLETAKGLDLKELPELSRSSIQEIFKFLVHKLSEGGVGDNVDITIWISGSHDAYSFIDLSNKNQKLEKCITSLGLFFWSKVEVSKNGEYSGGPVDMILDETPVDEIFSFLGDNTFYCLFLGAA